jgi:Cdc6-like AAA superfamily ATPase
MVEKKATTKKAAETKEAKAPAVKKATATKKAAVKAEVLVVNAENIGFKAGDVYQALAAAEKALNVKEIAKAAKISEEETLLGLGWLFKEGKLLSTEDNKIVLA